MTLQTRITAAAAPRIRVPLCDLGLAPENLRAPEPEDAEVPRLAETIRAAGLIYPPIVRAARRGEPFAYMVLDGRRRRFALLRLAADGAIPADHEVECLLAEDRAAQAAAAVLPNAEHAPVHPADVIVAIGKLRRSRLSTAAIAEALGYDETEVRRLEAMAHVHPDVLGAFRQGRLSLRQVRLFARLKDKARQGELAAEALDGYFHEHALTALVAGGRVTLEDPRFALVSPEAYAADGGRVAADLFGELSGEVLDPEGLDRLWQAAARRIAGEVAEAGVAVLVGRERGFGAPEGLAHLPFVHWASQPHDVQAAADAVRVRFEAAAAELEVAEDADARERAHAGVLNARFALARLAAGAGEVLAVLLTPSRLGLDATFYQRPAPPAPEVEPKDDPTSEAEDDEGAGDERAGGPWRPDVVVPQVALEVAGVSHAQHAVRTEVATQGLARDLADHPHAALVALTAQLFKAVVLPTSTSPGTSALQVRADGGLRRAAAEALGGVVWARLDARRAAYLASGERPIGWVAAMGEDDRRALLAELAAACLDLREARTTDVRRAARAEAAEIAALCDADLSVHWTPDAAFLGVHAKPQLLGWLAEMGGGPAKAAALKKDELVQATVEVAADKRWVPACLQWRVVAAERDAAPALDADVELEAEAGVEAAAAAAPDGPDAEAA